MAQNTEDEKVSVSKTNYSTFSHGFAGDYALPLLPLPQEWKNPVIYLNQCLLSRDRG